jgi:hypothetical protein
MSRFFRKRINEYDPYGIMQINALQAVTIVLGLLAVDTFYHLPGFIQSINLPILALVITGTIFGYYPRLKAIIFFCLASIIYTALFCFVKNYITLLVLVTGIGVASLFALSRKFYPPFLNMIALIQVVASVLCQTRNSGDLYQIWRIVIDLSTLTILTIIFISFFPKVYYFRVWKRALYYSFKELGEKFNAINLNQKSPEHLLLVHSVRLFDLTNNLSYGENGIFARRLALILTKIYTSLAALSTRTISIESQELEVCVKICEQFCTALVNNHPLYPIYAVESENKHFLVLQKNFNKASQTWNKLCLQKS